MSSFQKNTVQIEQLFGSASQLSNKRPLYLALQKRLRCAIQNATLNAGDILPAERDIAHSMNVSRVTVRRAINGLVQEGVLTQRQGAGTFVSPLIEQPLNQIKGFSEIMSALGKVTRSEWIRRQVRKPMAREQEVLSLQDADDVVEIYRQRLADDKPMALELSILRRDALQDPDQFRGSLYTQMALSGRRPTKARQLLRAVNIDQQRASYLALEAGAAVFYCERIGYDPSGIAVEYTQSWFAGDSYEFVAEILQAE